MGFGSDGFEGLLSEMGGKKKKKKDGECSMEEVPNSEVDCGGSELMGLMSSVNEKSVVEDHTGGQPELSERHNGGATNALVSMDSFSAESVKDNDIVSDSGATEEHESTKKRKRENNSDMLKWIIVAARDPCDLAIGSLPERSKWKLHSSEHLWKQALLLREALFLKPTHSHWKNKPMHPCMFEDSVLGCRQRKGTNQRMASIESRRKLQGIFNVNMSDGGADSVKPFWLDECFEEGLVLVGPEYQADVPEWSGKTEESDPKWLGSRSWPIGTKKRNIHLIEREIIGKERQDTCGCQWPGSLECVRFHITKKRERVKLELGPVYYEWKFDQMGEEMARFWTREEEEIFHDAVKSIPFTKGMRLFKKLRKILPGKDIASLVRYYFNVLILCRRANQNRTCPNDIDSDDEQ